MVPPNPSSGVYVEHDEALHFGIEVGSTCYVKPPVISRALRGFTANHVFRQGTIPQGDNSPLRWMFVSQFGRLKPLDEFRLLHDTPSAVQPAPTGRFRC